MTLVDLNPKMDSGGRLGSVESRRAPELDSAPAPVPRPAGPELTPRLQRAREWAQGPIGSVLLKGAGILVLMLGLGAVGAYAMSHGLEPRVALADAPPSRADPHAARASLTDAVAPPASSVASPSSDATQPTETRASAVTADGRVILNLATLEDLRKLPGVGAKRAEAILALRQKLGKFRRLTDLLRIRGIGPRRLKQLQNRLLLDPPPAPVAATRPPTP